MFDFTGGLRAGKGKGEGNFNGKEGRCFRYVCVVFGLAMAQTCLSWFSLPMHLIRHKKQGKCRIGFFGYPESISD